MKADEPKETVLTKPLGRAAMLGAMAVAVVSFHLAFEFPAAGWLIVVYLFCLCLLTHVATSREAFYSGFVVGYLAFAPQLEFFWTVFSGAAVVLWAVLAFWIGLFVLLAHFVRRKLGWWGGPLFPVLWLGLEYFRSELYYLRFAWLSAGFAFAENGGLVNWSWGVYGIGFLAMAGAVGMMGLAHGILNRRWGRVIIWSLTVFVVVLSLTTLRPTPGSNNAPPETIRVAGVQLEFPTPQEIIAALDRVLQTHPGTELLVLSEYTLDGPPPERLLRWCRGNEKFLVVGGKDELPDNQFYDTAFVIDPAGQIAFKQAKSVPIQFFKDGLPARQRRFWQSPWRRIAIPICYDLSYTRVMDDFVRQGVTFIINPTMDVQDWGRREHRLHAFVTQVRAAEYHLPIFRVASSGISRLVNDGGQVEISTPFPGQGAIIAGTITGPEGSGRMPTDRHWTSLCVVFTGAVAGWFVVTCWRQRARHGLPSPNS